MKGLTKRGIVLLLLAAAIALLAVLLRCGLKRSGGAEGVPAQAVSVSRAEDPEYRSALEKILEDRKGLAGDRTAVMRELRALEARARAALPAGADDAAVKKELEDNPKKYPGWRELSLRMRQIAAAAEKDLENARATVGARLRREAAERKAASGAAAAVGK